MLAGEFDQADRLTECGMPCLRIALDQVNYYPSLDEVRQLSFAQGVTWPDGSAVFPKEGIAAGAFLAQVREAA